MGSGEERRQRMENRQENETEGSKLPVENHEKGGSTQGAESVSGHAQEVQCNEDNTEQYNPHYNTADFTSTTDKRYTADNAGCDSVTFINRKLYWFRRRCHS